MHAIIHKERPDTHVEPPLVKEVHIADNRGAKGRQTAGGNAVKDARGQDASPAGAIRGRDISGAREHRRGEHKGPPAVDVSDGQDEQRAAGREDEEHGQLVRRRHGRRGEGVG